MKFDTKRLNEHNAFIGAKDSKIAFKRHIHNNYPELLNRYCHEHNIYNDILAWTDIYDMLNKMGVPYTEFRHQGSRAFLDDCLKWLKENPELVEFHLI